MNVLTAYRKDLDSCVILAPSETLRLKSLMDQGDQAARNALIGSILRMAWNVAKEYVGRSELELEDLVGEANCFAIKVIDTWEPERGGSLTTHTHWVLNHGLLHALLKDGHRGIYLPKKAWESLWDPNSKAKYAPNARAAHNMASVEALQEEDPLNVLVSQDQEASVAVCLADIERYIETFLTGHTRLVCRMYFGLDEEARNSKKIGDKLGLKMYEVQRMLKQAIEGMKERFARRSAICQWCNEPFVRETLKEGRCCSPECQKDLGNALRRAKISKRRVHHCERCKNPIPKSTQIRYCSKKCSALVKLDQAKTKRKLKRQALPSQQCKVCNQPFTLNSTRKRDYCSVSCCNKRRGRKNGMQQEVTVETQQRIAG